MRRAFLAALLAIGSCAEPTVVELEVLEPELTDLGAYGSIKDGGLLVVGAAAADENTVFTETQMVFALVETQAGDVEHVPMERRFCGLQYCAAFEVVMKPGFSIRGILPRLGALPSRLTTMSQDEYVGWGWVWRNADLPLLLLSLRSRNDVERADPYHPENLGGTLAYRGRYLTAARPIDDRFPERANGRIEASTGDTITVSYTQPSGQQLVKRVVMR